jgi:hypothetical protein
VPIANTVRSLGLNQTTPATGPAGSASHIIFSEDNSQLIASVKGVPPQPGFLAVWDVAADGSLSADFTSVAPQSGGLLPFSMTVIPGMNAILATDAGLGFDVFDFNAVAPAQGNATASGDRSSANAIAGQAATCWSSFSPKTGNFFLTDIGTSTITEVNVDANLKGTIVKVNGIRDLDVIFFLNPKLFHYNSNTLKLQAQPRSTMMLPQSMGTSEYTLTYTHSRSLKHHFSFLYVLAPNATSIDVLSLPAPGQAASVQKVDIAGPAKAAGITISTSTSTSRALHIDC